MLRLALAGSVGATYHGCRTIHEYCPANWKLPIRRYSKKFDETPPSLLEWSILAIRRSGISVPNLLHSHWIECRNPADPCSSVIRPEGPFGRRVVFQSIHGRPGRHKRRSAGRLDNQIRSFPENIIPAAVVVIIRRDQRQSRSCLNQSVERHTPTRDAEVPVVQGIIKRIVIQEPHKLQVEGAAPLRSNAILPIQSKFGLGTLFPFSVEVSTCPK